MNIHNGANSRIVLAAIPENGERPISHEKQVCTNSFNDCSNGLMDDTLKGFLVQILETSSSKNLSLAKTWIAPPHNHSLLEMSIWQ